MAETKNPQELDPLFEALGNQHRREMVYFLSLQPASISQLASMRGLSLQAIHKHVKILEDAGLVLRKKIGRSNFLAFNREGLRVLQDWLMQYHTYWGSNEETLENYAEYLKRAEAGNAGE
ncbi:MAG: ArsR family transcriptional regulator [Chloroflexi bacterium]|nr:MAG: ArsR family transcriptional regulator [Chloroflexota bacterium]MBL1196132.1 ArsR family transcriptional regulator [Chloroflexota bacterium]NOH13425.1 winged helix-turn-helix transcriptional regulator [Chloroflexota bacterium]